MIESASNYDKLLKNILPAIIVASLVISYWSACQKMSIRWASGDNNYCFLVIPLFFYLCWDRKERFLYHALSWNTFGLIPVLFSIVLILIGEAGSVETLLTVGIWGCVVGITFLLYGWRTRYLIFPLVILLFIVPLPPFVNRALTFNLKLVASTLATYMLRLTRVTVFQDGNIIDIGVTQLQVVDACSGLRYLMPLLLLALLVGYFFGKCWWRKCILILLILPLSVLLNSLRIWLSGIMTVMGHPELVKGFFHDFSGWVIFMIAGTTLYVVALILRKIKVRGEDQGLKSKGSEEDKESAAVGWTKPVVLTAMVCLMFVISGYALKQIPSTKNLPARISLTSFPMQIGDWHGQRSYIEQEILNQLWSDDYVQATYYHSNNGNVINMLIPFYEWQGTRHTAHAPQSCLLGGGWAILKSREHRINVQTGKYINIVTMALAKGESKILASYFFLQRGRVATSPWMNKAYLMWDAFSKRRTDGALVRAEMILVPGQTYEKAYPILEGFLVKLWPLLADYIPS